jgi:putative PIN family toxin of toxin-antitoxin system
LIRAVLDVNVLISSLISPQGVTGRLIRRLTEEAFEIVLSQDISAELRRALAYPRVRQRVEMSDDELELWLAALDVLAVRAEPTVRIVAVPADPDDDIYIEAALEARARFIVTGDKHLLDLAGFEDVRIVRARAFLDVLG